MAIRAFTPADTGAWATIQSTVTGQPISAEALLADEARRNPAHFSRRWVFDRAGEVLVGHLPRV
ncbi:hypothetical protein [Deinococcus sp. QL22]|uniref:hypothetical protein n=1 Tax=Deinococcus sp. QL22 TaxID=2939437 RepID=UPI0020177179|nr:hypothetical protein [Deinococcus sp. QL22]UQN07182.1 hypothetical protein M1R55_04555 [Deinococcus sp. QL22]